MLPLARGLILLLVLLLPVQMRAGASESHPHSLLQLLVDASDGTIDHHSEYGHVEHERAQSSERPPTREGTPDVPTLEESGNAAGSTSILATVAILVMLPIVRSESVWPVPNPWCGRHPALEPPPPRFERA